MVTNSLEERQKRISFKGAHRQALKFKVETEPEGGGYRGG
jgi:hypothetical protein